MTDLQRRIISFAFLSTIMLPLSYRNADCDIITSDKGGGICDRPRCLFVCLSVCLSVCLLARLLKNACVDLDKILRVDRCRDMGELVNF